MRPQRLLSVLLALSTLVIAPVAAGSASGPSATCGPSLDAGTLGIGDAYYPRFGNGGYDVQHYDLAIKYGPGTNHLRGVATIAAQTTQALSCFSLDLVRLNVSAITVNGDPATWSRTHHELMITPATPLGSGADLTVVVSYEGFPKGFVIPSLDAVSGFIRTADGVVVAGEPEAATSWFPVNDHPTDRASYTFRITVPNGYQVVANRFLRGMVRGLVGTMLQVGRGKLSLDQFEEILRSRDNRHADFSVPGHGLFLFRVYFTDSLLPASE